MIVKMTLIMIIIMMIKMKMAIKLIFSILFLVDILVFYSTPGRLFSFSAGNLVIKYRYTHTGGVFNDDLQHFRSDILGITVNVIKTCLNIFFTVATKISFFVSNPVFREPFLNCNIFHILL